MKESIYREQPEVTFKHEVLLILQGTSTVVGYSSFSNFNVFLGDRLRTVNIKVSDFFFMNEIIHIIRFLCRVLRVGIFFLCYNMFSIMKFVVCMV